MGHTAGVLVFQPPGPSIIAASTPSGCAGVGEEQGPGPPSPQNQASAAALRLCSAVCGPLCTTLCSTTLCSIGPLLRPAANAHARASLSAFPPTILPFYTDA